MCVCVCVCVCADDKKVVAILMGLCHAMQEMK